MNDDFIPKANAAGNVTVQTPEVLPPETIQAPSEKELQLKATMKLAEVMSDKHILNHMRASALWQQSVLVVKEIANDDDYNNAINVFTKIKEALKSWEMLRHLYVDFPTMFTRMVNDTFRPVKVNLEGVKGHMSRLISDYDAKKRQAAEEAERVRQAEVAAKGDTGTLVVGGDGTGEVKMEEPEPSPTALIPTVQKTEQGGRVQMREVLEVEVVDVVKLIKAIVSKSERNSIYTTDLISVNLPKLKELCKGKRVIPGVVWEMRKKAV